MKSVQGQPAEGLTRCLTYAGLVLVGYELVRGIIVGPIQAFYSNVTFGPGMLFESYAKDVQSRDSNEFKACLLYLRDFMKAIDSDDIETIQRLRTHRNGLAHGLAAKLPSLRPDEYRSLWEDVDRTLFKLSNYRVRMDIGADPQFAWIERWETVKGGEYLLFEQVMEATKLLNRNNRSA